MNVFVRVDSSTDIGSGHIMRCLTLANLLRQYGCAVSFICRTESGNLNHVIKKHGFLLHRLPELRGGVGERVPRPGWETDASTSAGFLVAQEDPVDLVIVDHYHLDSRWESTIVPYVKKIMVIDDLADRPHDCDILLDQNYYENPDTRYAGLIPRNCRQLLGPRYALLRPEFKEARKGLRMRDGIVRRVLVFFGGADCDNQTAKALEAMRLLNRPDIAVEVVLGISNPHRNRVKQMCSGLANTTCLEQVENMAKLMSDADLAIGAGGATTWERCFLGLPSITLVIAHNQAEATAAVARAGATWNLGWHADVSAARLADSIKVALQNPALLLEMSRKSMELVQDGIFESKADLLRLILEDNHEHTSGFSVKAD